ncbi:MAG: O-antigen ligase family protein [Bdellovibrionota bacterium]
MTSIYSILQNIFTGDFAVSQLLTAILFSILSITVVSFVKHYLPEKIDTSFVVMSLLATSVTVCYFAYFCTVLPYSQVFVGLAIALALGFCLMHPAIALANMVSYLILRPWELLENVDLAVLPRTFLLLFLISLIFNFYQSKRVRLNLSKQQFLIIALGAWVFLSTVFSGNVVESQTYYFDNYFKSIIVAVFIFQTIQTEEDYRLVTNSIVTGVLGVSVFALVYTYFIAGADRLEGRGAVQNANDLAALLIFIVPLSLRSILKRKLVIPEWIMSVVLVSIMALGVYKAQSRASYISIMLMGMAFVVYQFRHRRSMLIKLGILAVVGFVGLSQLSLGRESSDLDESRMNRLGYWKAGIAMAVRHPVLGVGYTEFAKKFTHYGVADFTEGTHRTAHSSWILLVSEAGFPALILMLVLMYQAAVRAWNLFPQAPELLLMVVGYGVCMTFLSHTYILYPYILLGLIFTYPFNDGKGVSNENPLA